MLFNIHTRQWDDELLTLLGVPREHAARGALVERGLRQRLDDARRRRTFRSPASPAISRRRSSARCACRPGLAKNTYGTGCFMLQNTGDDAGRLAATSCSPRSPGSSAGRRDYALEGSVFIGGAVVQWLRDGLGIIATSADVEALAAIRAGQRRRLPRAGVRRARRAALGSVRARHDRRHSRAARPPATSRAPRSRASRSRSPICSRRCSDDCGDRARGAARRRRRRGERPAACSSRPTCSACPSSGRR